MVETVTEEKVPLEAKNKPFLVCGFLGVFWNLSYGSEDHLGSTRMVLDENGTVKEALMYQPYGTVSDVQGITVAGTDPLRQKFTTKEFDEEGDENGAPGIDAYHFGFRVYDPDIGVWMSNDPADQYWNTYSYCGGDPVNFIDPDGAFTGPAWLMGAYIGMAAGATIGGVAGAIIAERNGYDWWFGALSGIAIGSFGGGLVGAGIGWGIEAMSTYNSFAIQTANITIDAIDYYPDYIERVKLALEWIWYFDRSGKQLIRIFNKNNGGIYHIIDNPNSDRVENGIHANERPDEEKVKNGIPVSTNITWNPDDAIGCLTTINLEV